MTNELVSVIMPSWNTGKYIAQSIESVIGQTYQNWELVLVDDGSSDSTDEVVASFRDPRIRYLKNEKNCGAALTRNRALREAKGDWIAFLDSDDLWKPEKLEKMLTFAEENRYTFIYHDYEKMDEASSPLNIQVSGPLRVTKWKMYRYGYPGCLTFMYHKKEFGLVQIEDIKKNNDYAVLLKLCKKGDCFRLPENLALYRIRKQSISHDRLWKKLKSHYDLFHICDGKPAFVSLFLACRNLFFGVLKKVFYEKKTHSPEN